MTYFEYLLETGKEDEAESYVLYLTEVCGYDEEYAKSRASIEFTS